MNYRPEIDGLRAISVLSVILFHAGFDQFSGGFVGVDVFFVISGYLITSLILSDLETGSFRLGQFYLRRARRIFPALFLVTVVTIPFALFLFDLGEINSYAKTVFGVATFSSNIVFWLQTGYFDVSAEFKPLLHTWSLAVEEQYYLLFPLTCLLFWRLGSKVLFFSVLFGFCVSFALGDWASYNRAGAGFYLLPTRAWEILAGALAAFYQTRASFDLRNSKFAVFLSLSGLCMILFSAVAFGPATPVPGRYILIPVLGAVLVILATDRCHFVGRVLAWQPLVAIGLLSYSLYLWHQPVFAFARYQSDIVSGGWQIGVLALLLVPLAYLSWRFVEVPFRKDPKWSGYIRWSSLSATIVIFGVLGWFGFDLHVMQRYGLSTLPVARQYVDAGKYVVSRWAEFVLRDFKSDDARKNVVLVGDSFAQDLLNAVEETSLRNYYELSTYHIAKGCGNIWTDRNLAEVIDETDQVSCREHQRYDHPKLQELLRKADEIWLASNWQDWHLPFIEETLHRLRQSYAVPIRVFGTKSFGRNITFDTYYTEQFGGHERRRNSVNPNIAKRNQYLSLVTKRGEFVDLQKIMCGSESTCTNSTNNGLLLSYDGGHLTAAGARVLGERLAVELDPD